MMKDDDYKPSEELKQYISSCNLISYRLVDGSYVIAEEFEHDEMNNVIYLVNALEFEMRTATGKAYLKPWIETDEDELITLAGDKIISRSETPFKLKMYYHRYFLLDKVKGVLTSDEFNQIMEQMFNPPVDNQDLTDETESWKIDNGFLDSGDEFQEDEGYKSPLDYHLEWRKKHKNNRED
jgi:hypothetical protein